MMNSIVLNNGQTIFITDAEFTHINTKLLNDDVFVDIPRLSKTYNRAAIYYVGVSDIFYDPKVKGGSFSFSNNTINALNGENEYIYDVKKGWKFAPPNTFSKGIDFDELLTAQTVVENDIVNNPPK